MHKTNLKSLLLISYCALTGIVHAAGPAVSFSNGVEIQYNVSVQDPDPTKHGLFLTFETGSSTPSGGNITSNDTANEFTFTYSPNGTVNDNYPSNKTVQLAFKSADSGGKTQALPTTVNSLSLQYNEPAAFLPTSGAKTVAVNDDITITCGTQTAQSLTNGSIVNLKDIYNKAVAAQSPGSNELDCKLTIAPKDITLQASQTLDIAYSSSTATLMMASVF
ncbi:MAG: hypothetical protein O2809_01350 [Proteobacteria bacterium]|nr:hypothetical protein [Pseudomonadota bacterium]